MKNLTCEKCASSTLEAFGEALSKSWVQDHTREESSTLSYSSVCRFNNLPYQFCRFSNLPYQWTQPYTCRAEWWGSSWHSDRAVADCCPGCSSGHCGSHLVEKAIRWVVLSWALLPLALLTVSCILYACVHMHVPLVHVVKTIQYWLCVVYAPNVYGMQTGSRIVCAHWLWKSRLPNQTDIYLNCMSWDFYVAK